MALLSIVVVLAVKRVQIEIEIEIEMVRKKEKEWMRNDVEYVVKSSRNKAPQKQQMRIN